MNPCRRLPLNNKRHLMHTLQILLPRPFRLVEQDTSVSHCVCLSSLLTLSVTLAQQMSAMHERRQHSRCLLNIYTRNPFLTFSFFSYHFPYTSIGAITPVSCAPQHLIAFFNAYYVRSSAHPSDDPPCPLVCTFSVLLTLRSVYNRASK